MQAKFKLLGRRVKHMRIDKGISQTNMAEMLGLSQTNLSNMEGGRTAITTQNLFKMQEIMGCRMADFFVDFDEKIVQNPNASEATAANQGIELEDAVKILKLLKVVNIQGL